MDSADFQEPDEARPAKRVRLDAPLAITEELQEEMEDNDDWDDIYGVPGAEPAASTAIAAAEDALDSAQEVKDSASTIGAVLPPNKALSVEDVAYDINGNSEVDFDVSIDAAHHEKMADLKNGQTAFADEPNQLEISENGTLDREEEAQLVIAGSNDDDMPASTGAAQEIEDSGAGPALAATNGGVPESPSKAVEDVEFLEAAQAQKDNEVAEWQFDSSDAESSDSDSDTSSETESEEADSGSEDGYEMLDPATAAKILMSGDGEDDEGKGKDKNTGDRQPRTANEIKEDIVPKPDVIITEEMKITYLGTVDRIVDNQLLIKAVTPGEYQVLEYGSVLCTEAREVVGAVADTFGRVQEPLYSVAFTNAKEIEDAGYEHGTKIFYVDSHSSFVFTQPLKNLKGTDASNIHDEEVGEDEIEFSDDEKEAEYKRLKKAAKREGRGGLSRGAFMEERSRPDYGDGRRSFGGGNDAPQQQYGGGMNYDDGDAQEEFYKPLKRPDNLSQLMAGGGPPRPQHGYVDRGRGRGRGDRGRGRGDRGRGRGGFENRKQRGGRGGFNHDRSANGPQNGHRGNAHSFPDRHNDYRTSSSPPRQHSLPSKPSVSQVSPPPQQQYGASQPHANQQSYQFNGFTFQYGNPPPQPPPMQVQTGHYNQQPQSAQSPTGAFPAGAYVNPAFFQGQQQWSHSPPQQNLAYAGWPQQQAAQAYASSRGANYGTTNPQQYQQQSAQPSTNLADILKNLGGQ